MGHGIEDLHRLADAPLTGQAPECIGTLAVRLARVGHSTGWDILAGVVAGMLAVFCMGETIVAGSRFPTSISLMYDEGGSDGHQETNPIRQ